VQQSNETLEMSTAEGAAKIHKYLTSVMPACIDVAHIAPNKGACNARQTIAEMGAIGPVNHSLKRINCPGGIYPDNTPEQWAALQRFGALSDADLAGQKITVLCISQTGKYCSFCLAPAAKKQCSVCREANYCSAGEVVLLVQIDCSSFIQTISTKSRNFDFNSFSSSCVATLHSESQKAHWYLGREKGEKVEFCEGRSHKAFCRRFFVPGS
jgi:hypothetical protein